MLYMIIRGTESYRTRSGDRDEFPPLEVHEVVDVISFNGVSIPIQLTEKTFSLDLEHAVLPENVHCELFTRDGEEYSLWGLSEYITRIEGTFLPDGDWIIFIIGPKGEVEKEMFVEWHETRPKTRKELNWKHA